MDQNPDVIRHNIEETRSALTEKLETLECEVLGTVRSAKEAVTSTVENVKETVEETVQTVKETFDLRLQVERHPWAMFGGSVAAGFVIGNVLPSNGTSPSFRSLSSSSSINYASRPTETASAAKGASGLLGGLMQQFEPELQKVKGIAIGVTVGLLRDALKQWVPESMARDFNSLADDITSKLGGTPVEGSVLETTCCESAQAKHGGSRNF